MGTTARSVLVVGRREALSPALAALLRNASYYSEVVTDGAEALELLRSLPFDVVILAVADAGVPMSEFVRALRSQDAASRRGSLLLLADEAGRATAQPLLNRGINRILPIDIEPQALVECIRALVESAPRVPLRTLIRLQVRGGGRDGQLLCQTDNVSTTGALVRTELTPEPGTQMRFELAIPGATEPVRGTAEVVRHATGYRERAAAVGLRFITLDLDGEQRLAALVAANSKSE